MIIGNQYGELIIEKDNRVRTGSTDMTILVSN